MRTKGNSGTKLNNFPVVTEQASGDLEEPRLISGSLGGSQSIHKLPLREEGRNCGASCRVYQFSLAAITNHYRFSSLKQHKFIILQLYNLDLWKGSHGLKSDIIDVHCLLEALWMDESVSATFPASRGWPHHLLLPPFCIQSQLQHFGLCSGQHIFSDSKPPAFFFKESRKISLIYNQLISNCYSICNLNPHITTQSHGLGIKVL